MADKDGKKPTTIVIVFRDNNDVALEATPDVDIGKFAFASWLLARQADMIAASATRPAEARSPLIALPDRQIVGPTGRKQ